MIFRNRFHRFFLPLALLLGFSLNSHAQTTVTVSADVRTLLGTTIPDARVQFCLNLKDSSGQSVAEPKVAGVGIILQDTEVCVKPVSGHVSTTAYANDVISVNGQTGVTTYTAFWKINGQYAKGATYVFLAADGTEDLNSKLPITVSLIVPTPTGDTTYARLTGGNQPFTGPIQAPGLTITGNAAVGGTLGVKGPRPWVDVTAFGAKGDGSTDDTTAIQQAINFACTGTTTAPVNATCTTSAESDVLIPQGTFKTTGCLQIYGSTNLIGAGRLASVIAKSNNANCTAGSIAAPARALSDNYAVDAIVAVVHPTSDYAYHWKIDGVGFKNTGTASTYGLFAPRASQSALENSYIANTGTGVYSNDNWLMTIRHTTVDTANFGYRWANDGSGNGTGTALTLDNVWAVNIALSCYNIFGLQYSSFNNTACDHLNVTNADNANIDLGYAAYGFSSSTNISINGAGSEDIHGTVLSSQSSVLSISAMRSLAVVGYTSAAGAPAYIFITTNGSVDINGSTFDPMTSPGSFFNLLTQLGGMLTVRSTALPTGGNTFNSFSGGSSIINMNAGVVALTNSVGVTTLSPNSAVFGAGATFGGNIIPSVNGGFNSGGPSNGWLNHYNFNHHFIETTAPSSGGGQDICYGDSTAHAIECSYNAGTFFQVPQVIKATSAAFATATTAGTCVQNTTVVTGATTGMEVNISPVSTPGVGAQWSAFVSSAGNVTINECAVAVSAGGTIAFNIRVTP